MELLFILNWYLRRFCVNIVRLGRWTSQACVCCVPVCVLFTFCHRASLEARLEQAATNQQFPSWPWCRSWALIPSTNRCGSPLRSCKKPEHNLEFNYRQMKQSKPQKKWEAEHQPEAPTPTNHAHTWPKCTLGMLSLLFINSSQWNSFSGKSKTSSSRLISCRTQCCLIRDQLFLQGSSLLFTQIIHRNFGVSQ